MHDDPPLVCCPVCRSAMVTRINEKGLWECQYHRCRAVFLLYPRIPHDQAPLIREDGSWYFVSGGP
ncbi:MAG TPA: hypothetical protein PKM87_11155 [Methanolinea sp.]|jgi:ribosomal protein L37AE/L43A|nr:hypothetical protein [Methanolinea sp.]